MVYVGQRHLLAQAVLALAERRNPSPHRSYRRADIEVKAFHKRGVALLAQWAQSLLEGLKRAEHDAVLHVDQTAALHGLDHLRVEQLR
jgi:hypothetical protein